MIRVLPTLLFLILVGSFINARAQDTASVYFYRPATGNSEIQFKIYDKENFLIWITANQAVHYVCTPGEHVFYTKTKNGSGGMLQLTLEPGSVNYVKAAIGYKSREPGLQQVDEATGKSQIDLMKIEQIRNFRPVTKANEDTLNAVERLFIQKRHGGKIRARIAAIVALSSTYAAIQFSEETSMNYTSNGFQNTPDPDNTAVAVCATLAGVSMIVAITGAVQRDTFSRERQTKVLDEYRRGLGIPGWVKSKLSPAYFAP